ncbi:hypothetical protein PN36_03610 [Candidatus Thiomargarita nelsonii]|uniref:Spermidine synthase n=1 Tax=Candidatus Thiomargarita nelsonii TaxID=1003181 RepID=A0A4E0R6S9_9GAMM|nr:hypothetical protein PN36_03610 [Candidatus Thiomargarita nelsonii]
METHAPKLKLWTPKYIKIHGSVLIWRYPINTQDSRFDPSWRDDVIEQEAIDIPLVFPEDTPPTGEIWVESRPRLKERLFNDDVELEKPRRVTSIVKRSYMLNYYKIADNQGNFIPLDDPIYNFIFQPKTWMNDSMSERYMMFAAAKKARGKVLVGGLGLAIYPQFVFYLQRPIQSITILEKNATVINLVRDTWINSLSDEQRQQVNIIEGSIEDYLQETDESFDTIYMDTWEDADPRFVPHLNYLVQLALPKCTGQIQCWGYAMAVQSFVDYAVSYVKQAFPLEDYYLDPGLERFSQWLQKAQKDGTPSEESIKTVAREIALTTVKSQEAYDRHRCFTPFAVSYSDIQRNMVMSRKKPVTAEN